MDELHEKYQTLQKNLQACGRIAVAFSGGVDSTFLLKAAHDALGDGAIAVTARSCSFPKRELREAQAFCEAEGVRQLVIESEEMEIEGFRHNPKNRCYLCKRALFEKMTAAAAELGITVIAEGSNVDDEGDYRPGLIAIRELGVKSPLREAGLTKAEIRALSRELGLPTWDKQSFACLSSRFVYGETITREKLGMVERAEQLLLDLGFRQVRVRIHGTLARIEVAPEERARLLEVNRDGSFSARLRELGFSYVTMDLDGYQTGSMNRTLGQGEDL